MNAHELLNLLNRFEKKIRCEALQSILSISSNDFNKFNNRGGRMQDSSYHMALKSHLILDFHFKMCYGRQHITLPGNLHI